MDNLTKKVRDLDLKFIKDDRYVRPYEQINLRSKEDGQTK